MQNGIEDERLAELLMQRVTGALSAPEADALQQALAKLPPGEVARWEQAAAELTAVMASADTTLAQPLPADLAARIISSGEALVGGRDRVARERVVAPEVVRPARARATLLAWSGWMAAAAALVLWSSTSRVTPAAPSVSVVVVNGPSALRDSLLAADSGAARLAWTTNGDSSAVGASGDVVWSGRAQRGVMRIAGLQPNDRTRWQYQLWIFDKTRDQKYPVDGGVFDVPAGQGEVFVPIDARVPVGDAVMFAVTVEKAGGVVVSTRERIALLAQRKG